MRTTKDDRAWKVNERRIIADETTANGARFVLVQECTGFWCLDGTDPFFDFYVMSRRAHQTFWQQEVRKSRTAYFAKKAWAMRFFKDVVTAHRARE